MGGGGNQEGSLRLVVDFLKQLEGSGSGFLPLLQPQGRPPLIVATWPIRLRARLGCNSSGAAGLQGFQGGGGLMRVGEEV